MITLEIANSIATLTLHRPPVNAISDRLIELFEDRLDEIDARPDCKVVHLRSSQKVFCAGAAMGGGLELALACDLRIIATDARVGLPEISLGLIPAGGGTQRLTRLCGRAIAARLIFGAEIVVGADAVLLGLAQWAAEHDDIAPRASAIVHRIATFPAAALRGSKMCIAAAGDADGSGYASEREATRQLSTHPETRERVAAFLANQSR